MKQIRGIGPAAERHLNTMGIWTFEQLAAMSSEQINELFAEKSRFKLLKTANWPTEAKTFAIERDGSVEAEVLKEIKSISSIITMPTNGIVNPGQTVN